MKNLQKQAVVLPPMRALATKLGEKAFSEACSKAGIPKSKASAMFRSM